MKVCSVSVGRSCATACGQLGLTDCSVTDLHCSHFSAVSRHSPPGLCRAIPRYSGSRRTLSWLAAAHCSSSHKRPISLLDTTDHHPSHMTQFSDFLHFLITDWSLLLCHQLRKLGQFKHSFYSTSFACQASTESLVNVFANAKKIFCLRKLK